MRMKSILNSRQKKSIKHDGPNCDDKHPEIRLANIVRCQRPVAHRGFHAAQVDVADCRITATWKPKP